MLQFGVTTGMRAKVGFVCSLICVSALSLHADRDVYLLGTPDYSWYAGCFGTATGNLMGYWDRNGFADFYTGPTAGGVAPLNNDGANVGIRSLWANRAGFDGRPANQPGHIDDYWESYASEFDYSYQDPGPDPYVTAGRAEHAPDCIGDFIGLKPKKMGEHERRVRRERRCILVCILGYEWESPRELYCDHADKHACAGHPIRAARMDAVSGLRRGRFHAVCRLQSAGRPSGTGFTFEDVKREIEAGYPFLVFLQDYNQFYRSFTGMPRGNPEIHGMMVYGYQEFQFQRSQPHLCPCRTSWGSGDLAIYAWTANAWVGTLSVRGVIGYRPKPKVMRIQHDGAQITISWQGPSSQVRHALANVTTPAHRYAIEKSSALEGAAWTTVGSITTDLSTTIPAGGDGMAFYRVKLLGPEE